jgi:diguanylate cyclase (GGDEF)-like protein
VFKYFPRQTSGFYTTVSILDHVKRLFVFQQIGNYPLLLANGLSIDGVYADWWREVWSISLMVAALFVFTIVLMIYLIAALKRRAAAEYQLALLANTDGLTGLCNRRRFDEALDAEWRRSQRWGTPIALLMIDADHFKAYNDRHGHQAGDAALAAIAACIANATARASDLAARYGGEEFAVLLPGVNAEGAFELAEKIRKGLGALRDAQGDRPDLYPTISVGLSCLVPQASVDASDLVREADEALYQAKRDGRDRIVRAPRASTLRKRFAA